MLTQHEHLLLVCLKCTYICVCDYISTMEFNPPARNSGVLQGHVLSPPSIYFFTQAAVSVPHRLLYGIARQSISAQLLRNHLLLFLLLPWQPGTDCQRCSDQRSTHL